MGNTQIELHSSISFIGSDFNQNFSYFFFYIIIFL